MNISAEAIMSKNIASTTPEESMHRLYFKMKQSRINYIPVIDKNGLLVGMITDHDLNCPIPSKAAVKDYMSTRVSRAAPDTPLLDIARQLLDPELTGVAIMDKNNVLGVIGAGELVKVLVPLLASGNEFSVETNMQSGFPEKTRWPVRLFANLINSIN